MLRASLIALTLVVAPAGAAFGQTTTASAEPTAEAPAPAKAEPEMKCRKELVTGTRSRYQTICVPANPQRDGMADLARDDFRKFQDRGGSAMGGSQVGGGSGN